MTGAGGAGSGRAGGLWTAWGMGYGESGRLGGGEKRAGSCERGWKGGCMNLRLVGRGGVEGVGGMGKGEAARGFPGGARGNAVAVVWSNTARRVGKGSSRQ